MTSQLAVDNRTIDKMQNNRVVLPIHSFDPGDIFIMLQFLDL